ncbi:hypothetical protein BRYFOR_05721 [Marvinbryantia formatexigens DSM 14469]|uniref:Uncharacterized protein n=1 Tax=Marvinbryantia formatexigens DSM 14469 TaxID=478749 RepID=C6LAS7_9FIRM|nr:hypothetical protein BRYFOR_05721 [Marvinbryantia formatexigens DSM 14469]
MFILCNFYTYFFTESISEKPVVFNRLFQKRLLYGRINLPICGR